MNEITLPYHLVIPSTISIIVLGVLFIKRKRLFAFGKWKWFWIGIAAFFLLYLLIVGGATCSDINAQWSLNKFDLNQDGVFSESEITPDQKEAMRNLTSDTGRNFSFISGLIFSAIIAILVFLLGKSMEYLKSKSAASTRPKT